MATVPTTHTVAVGDKITAADENTYVRDAVTFLLAPPRCLVYQTAVTAMATGVGTAMLFDTELYDTDSMHSTASLTSRITATTAGLYQVSALMTWAANTTGVRVIEIRKNGVTSLYFDRTNAASASTSISNVSGDVQLIAGDYIEMYASQTSGVSLNSTAGLGGTQLSARWVASS